MIPLVLIVLSSSVLLRMLLYRVWKSKEHSTLEKVILTILAVCMVLGILALGFLKELARGV